MVRIVLFPRQAKEVVLTDDLLQRLADRVVKLGALDTYHWDGTIFRDVKVSDVTITEKGVEATLHIDLTPLLSKQVPYSMGCRVQEPEPCPLCKQKE